MDEKQLMVILDAQIKEALKIVGQEMEQIIKKYIKKEWYDRPYVHKAYTRTWDYMNSLTVSEVKTVAPGRYEINIYFDSRKIHPNPPSNPGEWSQHQNINDGSSVARYIPEMIEYGQKSKIYAYAGTQPFTKAFNWLKNTQYHIKRIQRILKSKGFDVKIIGYLQLRVMLKMDNLYIEIK